jgi:hypothetical protein
MLEIVGLIPVGYDWGRTYDFMNTEISQDDKGEWITAWLDPKSDEYLSHENAWVEEEVDEIEEEEYE